MNRAGVAAVFPVIFLGELPDKTMFASLVMATGAVPSRSGSARPRRSPGMGVIATIVGVLLIAILPHRDVELAVALTSSRERHSPAPG